jgi:hypothetical protein
MKTKHFFSWIVAGAIALSATLFVACKEDKETEITEAPGLTAAPVEELSGISAAGDTTYIAVNSNIAWTATTEADWVTLTNDGATGNGTVTVTIAPNPAGSAARSATITLSGDGVADVNIAVAQEAGAAPYITPTPTSLNNIKIGRASSREAVYSTL